MRRSRRRSVNRTAAITVVAVAVLVAVLAAATVSRWAGDDDAAPETGPPEREEPTTSEPDPTPAPDVVTEDEDGAALVMRPGDTTALRLSNDWLWEEPQVSGAAVMLAPVDYLADPGYVEWQVEAVDAGTSEVTVAGAPNCGDEAACPPRSATFRFDVDG